MKTYPEGTKWAVRFPCGQWVCAADPWNIQTDKVGSRWDSDSRYKALAVLNNWRSKSATPRHAVTLVRIPPKRTTEDRIREAVKARTDAILAIIRHHPYAIHQLPELVGKIRTLDAKGGE